MGFDSFIGNSQAVTALRGMLASGRLPGALLFAGPEGVGKKTLAMMFAKALNCERSKDDFCGRCSRCHKAEEMLITSGEDLARRREMKDSVRRVEGLVYLDVNLVGPITRSILTEQIRQVRSAAYARPFEMRRRVFIIDDAQTIHWQAIDVLLKVLEEPPDTTTLILICPNAYELRPTIRSRCHRIQFVPVSDAQIEEVLESDARVAKNDRALAVRVAGGSIARAREIDIEQYKMERRPWLDFLETVAGKVRADFSPRDWKALFDSTKALSENREDFTGTLQVGYSLLRDLMQVLAAGANAGITNVDLDPRLQTWAAKLGFAGIETFTRGLDDAYRLQIRNVNQQLGFDDLALNLLEKAVASDE